MASPSATLQLQFPSSSYSKYRSQAKTNPLLNKLNNDTGYPQEMLSSASSRRNNRDYLNLNKKNLKNFFADRIPSREVGVSQVSASIDPARLFEIKRKQYELKNQTRITLQKSFTVEWDPPGIQPEKISEIFLVNDKTLDFKRKFMGDSPKNPQLYESINFRRGTDSYVRKCSKSIKKDAYDSVFGPSVSSMARTPKKRSFEHTETRPFSYQNPRKISNSPVSSTAKDHRHFSSLIERVDQHRQNLDPENKMGVRPYVIPDEIEDKSHQKTLMLTWIRDVAQGYKKSAINCNLEALSALEDITRMDSDYYRDMVNHKSKRLQVRSMLISRAEQIRSRRLEKDMNESGVAVVKGILQKIEPNRKQSQMLSISHRQLDYSSISSEEENELQEEAMVKMTLAERFKRFGSILVKILYLAKHFDITSSESIYKAFWKNPDPYEMSGSYSFFKAIKRGDSDGVQKFLDANLDFLYEKDHRGRSPLIYACACNKREVVKTLLNNEININKVCDKKRNALYYALRHDDVEIVQRLLQAGISVWSTKFCSIKSALESNPNPKIHTLVRNARKVSLAVSLQPTKGRKLDFWREHRAKITTSPLYF